MIDKANGSHVCWPRRQHIRGADPRLLSPKLAIFLGLLQLIGKNEVFACPACACMSVDRAPAAISLASVLCRPWTLDPPWICSVVSRGRCCLFGSLGLSSRSKGGILIVIVLLVHILEKIDIAAKSCDYLCEFPSLGYSSKLKGGIPVLLVYILEKIDIGAQNCDYSRRFQALF